METSAKTGVNVDLAFTAVSKYETLYLLYIQSERTEGIISCYLSNNILTLKGFNMIKHFHPVTYVLTDDEIIPTIHVNTNLFTHHH